MNPYLKDLQAFADLLAACNVVEESAVCDAEDYDGEQTLCCIAKAHSRLMEEETAICESLKRERDGLAKALQKVVTAWDYSEWLDENDIEAFRGTLQSLTPPVVLNRPVRL